MCARIRDRIGDTDSMASAGENLRNTVPHEAGAEDCDARESHHHPAV
jgi:hypothetical protein